MFYTIVVFGAGWFIGRHWDELKRMYLEKTKKNDHHID